MWAFAWWLLLVVIPKLPLLCVFGWVCFSCGRFGVVWLILVFSVNCSWYLVVFTFVDLWSGCRVVSFGLGLGCYNCLCRLGCCGCGFWLVIVCVLGWFVLFFSVLICFWWGDFCFCCTGCGFRIVLVV